MVTVAEWFERDPDDLEIPNSLLDDPGDDEDEEEDYDGVA